MLICSNQAAPQREITTNTGQWMSAHKKIRFKRIFAPLLVISAPAVADYKADIGYTELQSALGGAVPTGMGVKVTQVEASSVSSSDPNYPVFAPDPTIAPLSGKTFSYPGLTCGTSPCTPSVFSAHASGVAMNFYGNATSIAEGVNDIHSYEVNQWLNSLYISSGRPNKIGQATTSDRRIANHSWVGNAASAAENSTILRQVDRQVDLNEYIQVTASGSSSPLLSNGYNTIAVGLTNTLNGYTSVNIDSAYSGGRAVTDVVAPAANLSTATPYVAAATALLVQTGHDNPNLSLGSSNISGVGTIYNAERSETVKATLMAGADRQTGNSTLYGNITDYGSSGHQTDNGLDTRYGAGQLNVFNSYQIISGGEQNSLEDGGSNNGQIGYTGFDYDANFGGAQNSNTAATYTFTAMASETIAASLVWNVNISNDSAMNSTLHHLGLSLIDVSDNTVVSTSESMLDNTQNIFWQNLLDGHEYQLLVTSLEEPNTFNWDYSLAWHRSINTPVPVPPAFWLFGSALLSLLGFQRKHPA